MTGIGKTLIYVRIKDGTFPKQFQLGFRLVAVYGSLHPFGIGDFVGNLDDFGKTLRSFALVRQRVKLTDTLFFLGLLPNGECVVQIKRCVRATLTSSDASSGLFLPEANGSLSCSTVNR